MVRTTCIVWVLASLAVLHASPARAQTDLSRFELGAQVAVARSGEFDATDTGIGGRVAWRPSRFLGVEAELNVFPGDFPGDSPFSGGRVEGLFGATVGKAFDRIRPFARVRPGFLVIQEASEPVVCILIFPPPLACTLAAGRTVAALDLGGGVDITATARTFVRVDIGDRLLRYPGTVFDADRVVRDRPFFVHEFRVAAGAGVRF
jgi:hypothetical protein